MAKIKKVTIIIPSYGRVNMLENAIKSALNQTYSNIEIVVVDDNSPDSIDRKRTEEMMIIYESLSNVKYIKHTKNMNGSAARNTGIKNATGDYIAFLDNDDEFMTNKIELQVKRLEELPDDFGICYTKFIRRKDNQFIDKGIEEREGKLTKEILMGTFYISSGSNMLLKKEVVDKVNGFDENFKRRQDLEFLIRASKIAKIAHVNKICLIINKDDRANTLKKIEDIELNKSQYLKLFSDFINELPLKDQQEIILSQNLLNSRYFIMKKDFIGLIKYGKKNNINPFVQIKHIFYLLKRRVRRQCYGFKI